MKARWIGAGRLDRAETLQRRHLLALQQQQRRHAGQHRLAVDDHRAGAALAEPAAEFGGVELEIVAQHIEQRRIRIRIDLVIATIDLQCHHGLSRCVAIGGSVARPRRCLEKHGLRAPRVLDGLFNAGPCRLVAEARAQIIQQAPTICASLMLAAKPGMIGLRSPSTGRTPDSTMLAALRGSGPADRGVRAEIDPAIGQRPGRSHGRSRRPRRRSTHPPHWPWRSRRGS